MKDYKKTRIYRVYNTVTDLTIYIGYTVRKYLSKAKAKLKEKKPAWDWDKLQIELIKKFPCDGIDDVNKCLNKLRKEQRILNIAQKQRERYLLKNN